MARLISTTNQRMELMIEHQKLEPFRNKNEYLFSYLDRGSRLREDGRIRKMGLNNSLLSSANSVFLVILIQTNLALVAAIT
ncbi:hypothetical protein CROQUDRAFT_86018 [Cronartium quercuum f. sp. fusiforme G11]|uniref:Uncharacterized protein n=1 Tax=Cronartium quercuum f. sp. fusiforme G11 TaxID=708437 RepID=A0A9P6NXR8_9BASI|nr:hypothetical protein CROQUDRAFT_86018 [Cronartium quercuum f. sp. fusiforme G11]